MSEDDELVQDIGAGSQTAMEVLVRRHYSRIHAFVCRRIGDQQAAGDVTQEIFAKMLTSLHLYTGPGKFPNWLLAIAINRCRDHFRAVHAVRDRVTHGQVLDQIQDERANVWDLFERRLRDDRVQKAMRALPDAQREAIILSYFHGYRIREIAVLTGVAESTVKSRLFQGLAKLRKSLREGEEPGYEQPR